MAAYLESLAKVRKLRLQAIAPGHGHVIETPNDIIDYYVAHRLEREQQCSTPWPRPARPRSTRSSTQVYADVADELHPVARYSVHAHLLKLAAEGKVTGKTLTGKWSIV